MRQGRWRCSWLVEVVPVLWTAQEQLLPSAAVVPFDAEAAGRGAMIYSAVGRARGRASDIAIAACAQLHEAAIWTLNQEDFRDIPGLDLVQAAPR